MKTSVQNLTNNRVDKECMPRQLVRAGNTYAQEQLSGSSFVTGRATKNTRTPKTNKRKEPAVGRKTFQPISMS